MTTYLIDKVLDTNLHNDCLRVYTQEKDHHIAVKPIEFIKVLPGELAPKFFTGHPKEIKSLLQAFLNFAWKEGLRPEGYKEITEIDVLKLENKLLKQIIEAKNEA